MNQLYKFLKETIKLDFLVVENEKVVFSSGLEEIEIPLMLEGNLYGGKISSSSLVYEGKTYTVYSVDRLDTNSELYDDAFLRKTSSIFEDMTEGITVIKNNEVIFRNASAARFLNIPLDQKDVAVFGNRKDIKNINKLNTLVHSQDKGSINIELKFSKETTAWVSFNFTTFFIKKDVYKLITSTDITTQKQSEEKYRLNVEYLNRTLDSINEGVIIINEDDHITLFNGVISNISGLHAEDVENKAVQDVIKLVDKDDRLVDYLSGSEYKNDDLLLVTDDNLMRHVSVNVSSIISEEDNDGKVIIIIDISEIKKREKEILYLSYHDTLTGLYNRNYLEDRIRILDTKRQLPFAILMGDVNGLKITNDVFGHEAGDLLLRKVTEIMKQTCRQEDIIGRWGGDEFLVLLPKTTEEEAFMVLKRITRGFDALSKTDSVNGVLPNISLGYGVKRHENEDIMEAVRVAESNMYKRKMLSKESMYSTVITSMKTAMYEKSNETEEHSNRLFEISKKIATRYNVSTNDLNDLELLCMLHDIGKIGISDHILRKPGPLTDVEWLEMRTHPEIGFRIAQTTPQLSKVSDLILYHHEKFDGSGYPTGKKGYQIPLLNRILSVSDAYDAMTNDRTYRKALPKEVALNEIRKHSGTQFDPEVVKIFIDEMEK